MHSTDSPDASSPEQDSDGLYPWQVFTFRPRAAAILSRMLGDYVTAVVLGAGALALIAVPGLFTSLTRCVLVSGLGALLWILALALATLLLHRLWFHIQEHARLGPNLTIGLIFVPLVNLVWLFVALPGLALALYKGLRTAGLKHGWSAFILGLLTALAVSVSIAAAIAIMLSWLGAWSLSWLPLPDITKEMLLIAAVSAFVLAGIYLALCVRAARRILLAGEDPVKRPAGAKVMLAMALGPLGGCLVAAAVAWTVVLPVQERITQAEVLKESYFQMAHVREDLTMTYINHLYINRDFHCEDVLPNLTLATEFSVEIFPETDGDGHKGCFIRIAHPDLPGTISSFWPLPDGS
ncbi:MAG: hypothetical protein D6E12_17430 [Desulfovibrio sp.]|nr:MAG: hypothetical protein D6E12_17430 [Desulfovibrio sp.]